MIVSDEFLKKLRASFELNIYEVKIWTALLSRGVATAGELSDMSNVPRSRSYDVLESLEKKGFIIMKLGKPIKYIAVKPEEILKRMKDNVSIEADKRIKMLDKVKKEDLFTDIELLYTHGIKHVDPSTLAGSIRGRSSIYSQLYSVLEKAEKEVAIMTTADGFIRKSDKFKNLFKKLKGKGVKIKIATPVTKESSKAVDFMKDYAQIRNVDSIKARFVLVDNKELVFMTMDDKDTHEDYDHGIWVNSPYFVNALGNMFNTTWSTLKENKV